MLFSLTRFFTRHEHCSSFFNGLLKDFLHIRDVLAINQIPKKVPWIHPIHRIIFHIGIEVESTIESDGVGLRYLLVSGS